MGVPGDGVSGTVVTSASGLGLWHKLVGVRGSTVGDPRKEKIVFRIATT